MNSLTQPIASLIDQNEHTCGYTFKKITFENLEWRLTADAGSVGFIYRHIGEIQLLLGQFLGEPTQVSNMTMGFQDTGQGKDLEASHQLITAGYTMLRNLVSNQTDAWWTETIETPFFGTVTRLQMLGHILNHNAHHSGQIALTLARYPGAGKA